MTSLSPLFPRPELLPAQLRAMWLPGLGLPPLAQAAFHAAPLLRLASSPM
jgi:hypothetical protein